MILWFLRLFKQFREVEEQANNYTSEVKEVQRLRGEFLALNERYAITDSAYKESCGAEVHLNQELASVREAYDAEVQDHIRTKDRLDAAVKETARVWEIAEKALEGERFSYQSQINHLVQKQGGGVPYAEAHALPENAVPKNQPGGPVGRAGRMLPSQMAAMAQREGVQQIVEQMRREVEAIG